MNRKNKPLNFLYEFEGVMDFNQYILILTSLSKKADIKYIFW